MDKLSRWNGACTALLACSTAIGLSAQNLTVLSSFSVSDGAQPQGTLVQGTDGNLYGTTYGGGGGAFSNGTVFKVTPGGTLTTLYRFCYQGAPCADGASPYAGLVQASDGNFYGTTTTTGRIGGTVFKITPGAH
jgi:uncharacterized repeat protein (TIGR03803 family)